MAQIQDLTVHVVEPSPAQAKMIRRQLESFGIRYVDVFADAQSALDDMHHRVAPSLVISAMYLPDSTGKDLVRQMRQSPDTRDVAFMLLSSEDDQSKLEPVKQSGAVAMIPKPWTRDDLKRGLAATVQLLTPNDVDLGVVLVEDLHVLLVDDSGPARRMIRKVLENAGVQHIDEAVDGEHAVGFLGQRHYDLVVTDYNMPVMDGRALTEHIRTKSGQAAVPILMVTSEADEARLTAVKQAGVSAICDKPFAANTVREIIQQLLAVEGWD